jgi:arabinofuranan 3-O-arabinosyltransferase
MTGLTILSDAPWLTGPRILRVAAAFAMLALIFLGIDAWLHTRSGVTDATGEQLGRDFVNYWSGAHLAAEGQSRRVYDINAFLAWQRAHTAANAEFRWYSYPPVALLLSLPLAVLNFKTGLLVWLAAGWLASSAFLGRLLGWRMAMLVAFATPASFMNFLSGQNGQYTAALLGGGVLLLESNPVIAGVLFGLLCFKPQLAILIPIALAAGNYWRTFAAAGATVMLLVATSLVLFGQGTWLAFLHIAPINTQLMEHGDTFWHRMPTVFAMMRLTGAPVAISYGLQIFSSAAAILLTARFWRGAADMERKGAVLILATFLTTPYAWDYDLVALTFVAAWLAASGIRDGFRPWEKSLLALTVVMPLIMSPIAHAIHFQIAPLVLWSILLLTLRGGAAPDRNPMTVAS